MTLFYQLDLFFRTSFLSQPIHKETVRFCSIWLSAMFVWDWTDCTSTSERLVSGERGSVEEKKKRCNIHASGTIITFTKLCFCDGEGRMTHAASTPPSTGELLDSLKLHKNMAQKRDTFSPGLQTLIPGGSKDLLDSRKQTSHNVMAFRCMRQIFCGESLCSRSGRGYKYQFFLKIKFNWTFLSLTKTRFPLDFLKVCRALTNI